MDIVRNPLLCLEALIQANPQAETAHHDQIVRHFDEKARIYLMKLNGQISEYAGDMIKFKEKEYKAPFEPSKIAMKNLKKAN